MNGLIAYLKSHSVHDRKLALARALLAFGMLLTLLFNDIGVIANHHYAGGLPLYRALHHGAATGFMKRADLFMVLSPVMAKGVIIAILILVMTGYVPKVSSVLHVWACYSVNNYFVVVNGGDHAALVFSILLLPLCFTDPRKNQWQHKQEGASQVNIIANVALYAVKVQAAIVYLDAGVGKILIKGWRDGSALYYFTSLYAPGCPAWLRSFNEVFTLSPAAPLLSWTIIVFELMLAACLFAPKKIRHAFLVLALLFHFIIIFYFGLISFFFSMAGVLVLFLV